MSLRFAKVPFMAGILRGLRLIKKSQYEFIEYARTHKIEFGDATKRLPLPDNSVEVLYSSHMIEHLDREEMNRFLSEVMRVLKPGGIVRLAFPDIHWQVAQYQEHRDADRFVEYSLMTQPRPRSLSERLHYIVVGSRHHLWMYDGESLSRLLNQRGFINALPMPKGQTKITDPGPLDLNERSHESGYAEAEKPAGIH